MFDRLFKASKAVQASGVLLRAEQDKSMEHLRLLKLLYIADRESIKETGRPIVGGRIVAMDQGPLHSAVYDLVKGSRWDEPAWSEFIQKDGYHVRLKHDPGVLSLSRYEIQKLNEVAERYASMNTFDIVELETHQFQEWQKNYVPETSVPIPWEDVVEAVGRQDAERIAEEVTVEGAFDRLFAGVTN